MTFPNITVYVEVEVAGEKYHDIAHNKVIYQTSGEDVKLLYIYTVYLSAKQ